MDNPRSNDNLQQDHLVFVITEHHVLGFLIEPFAVGKTPKGLFEYNFKKIGKHTYQDYFEQVSPQNQHLIELLHKYADENLQKRFSSQRLRTPAFYESLKPEYVLQHIRPFIDKTMYEAVNYMVEHKIPLYYKGQVGERILEQAIVMPDGLADTCFHFEKLPGKTLYRLEIRYQENDIRLYRQNALLISQKPCLLLMQHHLFRFDSQWDGKKLQPFLQKEFLEVPASAEKQFFQKFVLKSILHHPYKAAGIDIKTLNDKPEVMLKLEEHWQGSVVLGLYYGYGSNYSFSHNDPEKGKVRLLEKENQFAIEKVIRDPVFEKAIENFLKSLGLTKIDGPYFSLFPASVNAMDTQSYDPQKQIRSYIDWLNTHYQSLVNQGIQTEKTIFDKTYHTGKYHISLKSRDHNDWFDLHGVVYFGDIQVPFAYLAKNILAGNREYILPDGSIAIITQEWMSKYLDIVKFAERKGNYLHLRKFHYPLFAQLQQEGVKLPEIGNPINKQQYDIPPMLNASLRCYQKEGYNWMLFLKENQLGGCLADDMGLGKTLQALAVLLYAHVWDKNKPDKVQEQPMQEESQPIQGGQLSIFDELQKVSGSTDRKTSNCSMIIMPLSLIHNWMQEIRKFAPDLKVLPHIGTHRADSTGHFAHYDLVLTTYGTVRVDIDLLKDYNFRYVILDESQAIKNPASQIFSAIKKLNAQHRLVLTGTPVENSLTDLWSQFSFINPGMLGSLGFFKKEFVLPIEKRKDEKTSKKLRKLIEPFVLRRTKSQVAKELPELTEIIHYCEMTPEQQKYYETKKSEIRNAILENIYEKGVDKSRILILSGLTRLRLIANHPAIVDNDYIHESGKYNEIRHQIDKLLAEDHKVLVFSQFVKHLNLFRDQWEKQGLAYSYLTGKIAEKDRQQVIQKFQQEAFRKLFLISLRAGGVGLNLTQADYVFMLDPWWNPAVENQAINRAHRIGQDKKVFVYKFITRNTVEEKILHLQQRKSKLAGMFVNENNPLKALSFEELKELI